jgi:hypothetical protein
MKSFVDDARLFRWVNKTPWSTEDLRDITNLVIREMAPEVEENRSSYHSGFWLGMKTVTFNETTSLPFKDTLVSGPGWSNPMIQFVKRANWYTSPTEALAAVSEGDVDAAPMRFRRKVVAAIYSTVVRGGRGGFYDMSKFDDTVERLAGLSVLRMKRNKLEPGEQEINSTLRLRKFRQAATASRRSASARRHLKHLNMRVERFESNGVELPLTDHEKWILTEAIALTQRMEQDLDKLSADYRAVLRSIE